jgi:hypothetical protein
MITKKFSKHILGSIALTLIIFVFSINNSNAYPVFAQQGYANPRAAN